MTIGIFTAMQKEATSFLSDGTVAEKVGDFSFYRFKLGRNDAVGNGFTASCRWV